MNSRGFSLIELMTVIALIGILCAMGTFTFSQYSRKSQIASQTRVLYGDLMEYRTKSMYEKKNWTLKIAATGYSIYSSANTTVAPTTTVLLKHDVTSDNTADIVFNSYGFIIIPGNLSKSVCVSSSNEAPVDSIVITPTRIQIGKKREGASCAEASIDAQ